jgi:hypothetical protein
VYVESYGTDGVMAAELVRFQRASHSGFSILVILQAGKGVVSEAGGTPLLREFEALPFAIEHQFRIVNERHAIRVSKFFCAGAHKIDVRALLQDEACGLDGIAQALYASHSASLHAPSIHQESVKLNATIRGQETPAPGVKGGVVFQHGNRGFDCINGSAAASKDSKTCFERISNTSFMGRSNIVRDCPCSAVNEQRRLSIGISHLVMVADQPKRGFQVTGAMRVILCQPQRRVTAT